MPTVDELRKAVNRPQISRLKQLGHGLRVYKVLGRRVLIRTVKPYTQMDEVEKKGLLYVPEEVKEKNTPLPSTGIVIQVGEDATDLERANLTEAMVMFSKHAGSDLVVNEEDFRILDIDEVMCIFELDADTPIAQVTDAS